MPFLRAGPYFSLAPNLPSPQQQPAFLFLHLLASTKIFEHAAQAEMDEKTVSIKQDGILTWEYSKATFAKVQYDI